jgi:hypothetical protein
VLRCAVHGRAAVKGAAALGAQPVVQVLQQRDVTGAATQVVWLLLFLMLPSPLLLLVSNYPCK